MSFEALHARTKVLRHPTGPHAYDCLKIVVVRTGSAIVFSEFGARPVAHGDVILLGPSVLFSIEPENNVKITTISIDVDFAIDQFFWQNSSVLNDRFDAQALAEKVYSEPAQILRIGADRAAKLRNWLDEMVALSVGGRFRQRFHRIQALWFAIMDVLVPFIRVSTVRLSPLQRARTRPISPRTRQFSPLRREALLARESMHQEIAHPWTLRALAGTVNLSPQQLTRVFTQAFGKTPTAYLTMLRVEEMARLLRETNLTVAVAGKQVGWRSRSRATEAFTECTGMSPSRYRLMRRLSQDCTP